MSSKYLATAAFQSSSNDVKYSMFIGRWQPWHAGHRWLIDQRLKEGKRVLLAIRDVEPDEKNPWTPQEVLRNLTHELLDLIHTGKLKIIIIPDIESVNIGRGVGYDIIEHIPPDDISSISATGIRNQMKKEGKL
jgi:nicotinamide mononucleotide adenylyltransferase